MIRVTSLPLAPFSRRQWRGWLAAMLASVGLESEEGDCPATSVELVLMRDGDIAALNFAYLGCPGPTNVLSFPAESEQPAPQTGGATNMSTCVSPDTSPDVLPDALPGAAPDASPDTSPDTLADVETAARAVDKSSFDADQGRTARNLGSLFLSVDTLRRECLLYGQDEAEHARRLLAHGLAHLLGHDHGPAMDAVCETMLAARFA